MDESRIIQQLQRHGQELIRRKSLSGAEESAARYVVQTLREMGVQSVEIDPLGSVLAVHAGRLPGPQILFDAHLDTVDVADPGRWTYDPFAGQWVEGRLVGRGASDMKGALACMLVAWESFIEQYGDDFAGTIALAATVHEEDFEGVAARALWERFRPEGVIVGEATGLDLYRGQRGRAELRVTTAGVSAHSALPQAGHNAVYDLAQVIGMLRRLPLPEHPGLGVAGMELTDVISDPYPGASTVPERASSTWDRRLLPEETPDSVLEGVGQWLESQLPELSVEVELVSAQAPCWTGARIEGQRFFPGWILPEAHPWVRGCLEALRRAGLEPRVSTYRFCTNASAYAGEAGIPTIGFGPGEESRAHTVDEYVTLDEMQQATRGYKALLEQWISLPRTAEES